MEGYIYAAIISELSVLKVVARPTAVDPFSQPQGKGTLGTEMNRHLNKKQMLKSKNIYVLSHLTWKDKPVV